MKKLNQTGKDGKMIRKNTLNMVLALLLCATPAMAQDAVEPDAETPEATEAETAPAPEITPEQAAPATEETAEPATEPTEKPAEEPAAEPTEPPPVENDNPAETQGAKSDVSASAKASAGSSVSDVAVKQVEVKESREPKSMGLSPAIPDVTALPGGVVPAFGQYPSDSKAWRFDFHGLVYLPLRFGINERKLPGADQKSTVLHAPPRVPGNYETFGYTSVVPDPWTQLNFSYGNNTVTANVVVAARTVSSANGYFNPPDMLGINDAYITFEGSPKDGVYLRLDMGGFANRYGAMGEYDLGRYSTPLIARVSGTGLTGSGQMDVGNVTLMSEVGFQGQLSKAPVGVEPAGWNGFADPNVGSSFAAHGHLGLDYKRKVTLGGHYIHAFTRDDRATTEDVPDGSISVGAADLRLTLGRFGHLYVGYSNTQADTARAVSNVVRILNAPGGPGLMQEYLGPDSEGTGSLNTVGGQYDFSLGNVLRYPDAFEGNGPDLTLSAFGIYTHVKSPNDEVHDGIGKFKAGGELGYAAVKWLALGARYDHVMEHIKVNAKSHSIITGRLIFHSDWNSQDQLVLQYSYFNNGSKTTVREGYPPVDDPTINPDEHVISITASMWW